MEFGGIIYYLVLNRIDESSKKPSRETSLCNRNYARFLYYVKIFMVTAVLGGVTEYISSYVQEKAFGTISWDYSHLMFNLNGRTSLLHCTYWGIAGVMYVIFIAPYINRIREKIANNRLKLVTITLSVFMLFNITISCAAAERQEQRRKNIEPKGKFDMFLDAYYPDEYMDRVYANKKERG